MEVVLSLELNRARLQTVEGANACGLEVNDPQDLGVHWERDECIWLDDPITMSDGGFLRDDVYSRHPLVEVHAAVFVDNLRSCTEPSPCSACVFLLALTDLTDQVGVTANRLTVLDDLLDACVNGVVVHLERLLCVLA